MKNFMKTSFSVFLLLCVAASFAQTICGGRETAMASDASFIKMHLNPKPYKHVTTAGGKSIVIPCPDGTKANVYVIRTAKPSDNWLFVFQEWWGLNDYVKSEAERFFKALNVNVMALDMYDGKVASDAGTAAQYMKNFSQERGNMIVKGGLAYVGAKARIATVGWCFGGGQSMQAALAGGEQTAGCVIYYGMPEEDVDRLMKLRGDVLFIWPNQDKWINQGVADRFKANMQMAGKDLFVKEYDADHAFANPSNPKHNKPFAENAFQAATTYLKERFAN